jgi:peptidoglycan/xylan/chitin deacetylase (PgdA/CDA1 family)
MLAALLGLTVAFEGPKIVPGKPSRTVVLTYHDIIPKRTKTSVWFDCTVDEFRQQLDWLSKQGATFGSVSNLKRSLTEKAIPAPTVVITFADGYRGFYMYALPELRKRKIPVAMFVHTDYVGSSIGRPKMSWDELRECHSQGVTVASQTASHPADLAKLTDQQVKSEFLKSQMRLRSELPSKLPSYLAYPNGKYDQRSAAFAKQVGYEMAFTEAQRPAERAPSLYLVPRYVHTKYREAWRAVSRK